jgi:hypothetical protein
MLPSHLRAMQWDKGAGIQIKGWTYWVIGMGCEIGPRSRNDTSAEAVAFLFSFLSTMPTAPESYLSPL